MSLYEIRLCRRDEYDKLIKFIHDYWNKEHIFCKSKEIFEFQHGKAEKGTYDFVIAIHKETAEIHAVLGFITFSRYDKGEEKNPQAIYGALWKACSFVQNSEAKTLGLKVLYYLTEIYPNSPYITLGLSKNSQYIYKALHFDFGVLKHYYIANMKQREFKIAKFPIFGENMVRSEDVKIIKMYDIPEIYNEFFPKKNSEYLKNRYVNHPKYEYDILGILTKEELKCIWVIRKIYVEDHCCLRLVDMVGRFKELKKISGNVQLLLEEYDAEYIDCYNYGIEESSFFEAGFLEQSGDTIIPNYFEPFERRNVDIHYASNGKKPIVVFKGDGDQDRPSIL